MPYQTIWLTFFNPSICLLTEAVNPFYIEKHSLQIEKQMKEGKKAHEINVNMRISTMKPLDAKWVISFYDYMKNHSDFALGG